MSHSQFTSASFEDEVEVAGRGSGRGIVARGPLLDVPRDRYIAPFAVHVTIIQNPPNDPDPQHAKRAVGFTTVNEGEDEWVATIDTQGVEFDRTQPARGIGVAVLARTEGYASEVLTWCDHIARLDGTTNGTQSAA
jgi:hypothetical protein